MKQRKQASSPVTYVANTPIGETSKEILQKIGEDFDNIIWKLKVGDELILNFGDGVKTRIRISTITEIPNE